MRRTPSPAVRVPLAILATCAAVWLLDAASAIALPLVTALLLAALLRPLPRAARNLLSARFEWVGTFGATLLPLLAVVGLIGAAVWAAVRFPDAETSLQDAVQAMTHELDALGLPMSDASASVGSTVTAMIRGTVEQTLTAAGGLVLGLFLLLLGLEERGRWPAKMDKMLGEPTAQRLLRAWDTTSAKLRIFLVVRAATGAVSGALTVLWLTIVGAEQPVLWGVMMFLLNFVPTVGSILAGIPPMLATYASHGIGTALAAGAGMLVIEQVVGNYLDPKLQGRQLRMSTFTVLVAIGIFGWLWGGLGALLAVPMLIAIKSAAEQFDALEPLAVMISSSVEAAPLSDDVDHRSAA